MGKTISDNFDQMTFFKEDALFPSTRFQGSKLKIVDWIWENIKDLNFCSALDAFGGTGSVSYMLKQKGKAVDYNDILKFNWHIARALIENNSVVINPLDLDFLVSKNREIVYPNFIEKTFSDIYFTKEENIWIDIVSTNIRYLEDPYKQALAYFALFQACLAKRPYNLFHRKNLYLRLNEVERNFGNKSTWDKPFEQHFRSFIKEANRAVFSNGMINRAYNLDVFSLESGYDLVYIDSPYISKKGIGVDYQNFYHFLEGIAAYDEWESQIDYNTKNKRLKTAPSAWVNKKQIFNAFDFLFEKFKKSILVVSYRSEGIPSIKELENIMRNHKKRVSHVYRKPYKYVLSKEKVEEVLLIGE